MKRHSGAGFGVLAMASLLGIASVNEDIIAGIAPSYTITTLSGSASPCHILTGGQESNPSPSTLVGTSVNPGVMILSANQQQPAVTSNGQEDTKLNSNGYHPVCVAGLELYKDNYCYIWWDISDVAE